ncbi:polynucleotide adenylyltransferase PcnB [Legionella shakespearei]|uniref:polynucleotide adenylyltransferase PcnB n=1 Tax=Legionella shakespearei TaxID=45075 RepID=UPI00068722F0|nr:polynucleotide adenylyltransferase PcnB [Legionella shakespearei]
MLKRNRAHKPLVDSAYIIPRTKHTISKSDISHNALKVLNRLISNGFQAYLVGGSVRDLLLHKAPKDFDVATNATPNEIKNLFRNGRIIGRRFKLVHILFHREIIEVATFRGHDAVDASQQTNERGMLVRDNVYGSLDEDAWRRDFTVNSLYYNIDDSSIIDFTGGVKDVQQKLIRMIGDPVTRYKEDPVRMLRAIRFSAKLHFKLAPETEAPFPQISHLITHVSNSRLFDEMTKLYQCGEAETVQKLLIQYGLFEHLCAQTASLLSSQYPVNALLGIALENTDTRIRDNKPVTPAFLFAVLLWFPMIECSKKLQSTGLDPLPAIEKAMSLVIAEQNKAISIPKRYTQVIREIWLLQYRFSKRAGGRAFNLLQHPRFRAAFDFMALRALAGDESMELAQWWTTFQDVDETEQAKMVADLTPPTPSKPRRRRKPKAAQ